MVRAVPGKPGGVKKQNKTKHVTANQSMQLGPFYTVVIPTTALTRGVSGQGALFFKTAF